MKADSREGQLWRTPSYTFKHVYQYSIASAHEWVQDERDVIMGLINEDEQVILLKKTGRSEWKCLTRFGVGYLMID